MAPQTTPQTTRNEPTASALSCLWREAFGPGYAIGPHTRLVDYVARASEAGSPC